ncbi:hypothetical protein ANRL4_02050 [Anaerolineae bacterium]|nr:hypothetical protein ANRL4_02050 [Anaerolineae bacterium]
MKAENVVHDFQRERLRDIRDWYKRIYRPLRNNSQPLIRYIVLWSVFNALYNVADLSNTPIIQDVIPLSDGRVKPRIRRTGDRNKVVNIAAQVANDKDFVRQLAGKYKEALTDLATRRPSVSQPNDTSEIRFEKDGTSYVIQLDEVVGIASLDNRMFLPDGTVLFEYANLDIQFDDKGGLVTNEESLMHQIMLMLYQLRNNIVHGGSAAFGMMKKHLVEQTVHILEDIVDYLLTHEKLVLTA